MLIKYIVWKSKFESRNCTLNEKNSDENGDAIYSTFHSNYQVKVNMLIIRIITLIALILSSSVYSTPNITKNITINITPKTDKQCKTCHQQSTKDWQKSDHAKAMAIANKANILGNFDNIKASHYGQKAVFFIQDNLYQVTLSYDEKITTYPIKYTFGYFPLQQYLVETERGKFQVLPFAWDTRSLADGGQRWFHNYSHEEIRPEDRLHWQQPLQNWNGMCADCHSDGLVRNYNADKNSFSSHFDNINVSCISCHGNTPLHRQLKYQKANDRKVTKDTTSLNHQTGQWIRNIDEKTAHWQGGVRDNTFMDNCFSCHALRSPLTDGIKPNTPFLDQFSPTLLTAPMYHADGQIKEEVYVYGSFLQSKMYSKGVNCLDCHDKHTMKVKLEGNGLCLQCHSRETYNQKKHHQHEPMSAGAQCVNCHMPTNRYMGVDDRRDHSFKIPRPDLSSQFNTPNACTYCHRDKTNQWAKKKLENWYGKPKNILHSKRLLMRLNNGETLSLSEHLSIIDDDKLDVISRATAIQLLRYTTSTINVNDLTPYLMHPEPLIRLAASQLALLLPIEERIKYLSPLLKDKYKAIRIAAARGLVSNSLFTQNQPLFDKAFKALMIANNVNSWRGEGLADQAMLATEMNNVTGAEKLLKDAIKIDPYFDAGYINLADMYRAQQKPIQVASVLSKGIKNNPKSAALYYSYGLHCIRQKKMNKAIRSFKTAMNLSPNTPQFAYTYILALDGNKQSKRALSTLKKLILTYQDKTQLIALGLYLSQKLKNTTDHKWFMRL